MQTVFIAFCFSTLMLKTNLDTDTILGGTTYLGIIFYGLIHNMLTGYSEMAILVGQLPVYFKQRTASFYPAWSFTVPPLLLRIPFCIVDCMVFCLILYWATGLTPEADRFFIFYGYMLLLQQMATALFRMCAAIARNYDVSATNAMLLAICCNKAQGCAGFIAHLIFTFYKLSLPPGCQLVRLHLLGHTPDSGWFCYG